MTKRAQLPDGTILEFPDETPDAVMDRAVQSHLGVKPQAEPEQKAPQRTPPASMSIADRARQALGGPLRVQALAGRAGLQGLAGLADTAIAGSLPGMTLAMLGRPLSPRAEVGKQLTAAGVPEYGQGVSPETARAERILGPVGEAVTGTLATAGLGGLGNLRFLAAAPRAQLVAAGTGTAAGEIAREAGATPRQQLAAGVAGGLAPGGVTALARRAPASARSIVEKAGRQNIPIRRSSLEPTAVNQALRSLPGTGAKSRYGADVAKVNERLAELIGAPKGTPPEQVYPAALARNSAEYDDFARNYSLQLTAPLLRKLTAFRNAPEELGGPSASAKRQVDQFLDEAAKIGTGTVPGGLFKQLDTELGTSRSVRKLKDALRDQFKSGMNEADASRWDDLQRRYGDMRTVERLFAKAAGKEIDPRALLGAVTATKRGAAQQAAGRRGALGELAETGRYVIAPKGGAANLAAPGLLTLGPGAAGFAAGSGAFPAAAGGYGLGVGLGRVMDQPLYTQEQLRQLLTGTAIGAAQAQGQEQRGNIGRLLKKKREK